MNLLKRIEQKVLSGEDISYEEAVELVNIKDENKLFSLSNKIRERFKGNRMDLCTIMNAKSGKCSEDCKYCAQSSHHATGVEEYSLVDIESVLNLAKENEKEGVHRFSLVTSGKVITDKEFEKIIKIYSVLKKETNLKLCASLGCISYEQALKLKECGVSMYHHNIETCREYFDKICSTHSYEDRINTVKNVKAVGLDVCCGGIIGMGESMEQRIKMAFEIKELGVKSIPINILNPIKGTPLESEPILEAWEILRTIAIFRVILPDSMVRYAGGRASLGEMQKVGFEAGVNAALVGNYLTTIGNNIHEDIALVKELGFEV